ncbi:MAG: helix-turn-helix domain-containing protein [Janthinobacterium lividum]
MDYPIKTLGQLRPILRGVRKSAGFTQAMLAERLGVTQQTYAQLEANPTVIGVERLFKVLSLLGVELTLHHADAAVRNNATGAADHAPVPSSAGAQGDPGNKRPTEDW